MARHPAPARRRRGLPWLPFAVAAVLLFLGTLGVLRAVLGPDAMSGWFDVGGRDGNSPGRPSASEKVRVPDVAGLTRKGAERRLTEAGLEVGQTTSFPSDRIAFGRVIAPGIDAGTPVARGTEVNLTLSSGPSQPSASPSATAQPSPEPAASSAGPSASAPPIRQEERPAVEGQAGGERAPGAKVPDAGVRKRPPARDQNAPAGNAVDDNAGRSAGLEDKGGGNSGPGANSGRGSNSGRGGNSGGD
jgi:hypothetical protein